MQTCNECNKKFNSKITIHQCILPEIIKIYYPESETNQRMEITMSLKIAKFKQYLLINENELPKLNLEKYFQDLKNVQFK